MATKMALAWSTVESACKLEYSNLSLNGHLMKQTPRVDPCLSYSNFIKVHLTLYKTDTSDL